MKILVLNCGSSSLKYQLIDMADESVLAKGLCERIGIEGSRLKHEGTKEYVAESYMPTHTEAIQMVIDALLDGEHGVISSIDEVNAVGHRVVHGGEHFSSSVLISDAVKNALEECSDLAPLHNPPNLIGINACEKLLPGKPQVGVFDTAFHQTMPDYAYMYGLPYSYYKELGIRRYGFHGTSHNYLSQRVAEFLGKPYYSLTTIVFHLGNGSSVSAVDVV